MTPQERGEAVGHWLSERGGTATPGEIGAAFGLNGARQADAIKRLKAAGLVEGAGRIVRLTARGWARFTGVGPGGAGAVLDRVHGALGDDWPVRHRAFLELLVSAVIARHHLGASRPEPHLGFIAIGETATGKGATGGLVCHLFDFDPATATVHLQLETAGSLLGRREAVEGGGWQFLRAPTTRGPFLLLDELDKADLATRRAVWPYLDGRLRVRAEGQMHELLPTPMLAANPPAKRDRYGDLPAEYRRRCVVLDTGYMRGRGPELERMLIAFYKGPARSERLTLDRLVPPAELHPDAIAVLDTVAGSLTEAGLEEFPGVRALELATLGRCALLGPDADHVGAALQTGIAYLIATSSVPGQVLRDWAPNMVEVRGYLGAGGQADQIDAALQRARRSAEDQHAVVRATRQRKAQADLAVVEAGATLQAEVDQLRGALGGQRLRPEYRPRAAGLRKALRQVAETAGRVTTATGLEDATAAAAEPIARARALLAEDAHARELDARQRSDAREAERRSVQQAKADAAQLRQWQLAQERADREHAREALGYVVAQAQELEPWFRRSTTRPGEDPFRILAELRVDGRPLLTYRAPAKRPPAEGFRGFVGAFAPAPQGSWHAAGGGPAFPGTPTACPALSSWGANTKAALTPVLAHLHQAEDDLRRRLGRARRGRRPVVSPPQQQLPSNRHLAAIAAP